MKNKNIFAFILMHLGFLIYSLYSLFGKFASKYEFLSFRFCLIYIFLIFILFIYAIIWQQVLKFFDLSFATANKSATIIWGLIWGILFFSESFTIKKTIAICLIIAGIIILSISEKNNKNNKEGQIV